jgi:hypothetical protein
MSQADVTALQTERSAAIAELATYRAQWLAAGSPITGFDISVNGVSYQWGKWQSDRMQYIKELNEQIRLLSSPWLIRTSS